ncbi:LLM class flavin-dependent oxidoreductase [Tessaracoccus coleopterorum]|uniref:LLM class flavin-dependent oxidoreductase n=1 Tax=Tessaracoccus coleopterorum TaxID=2714950 RepID=UPI0018D29C54|nr:LLM class flavin-dependent oxidoreductase [Tessaracoccus coleopterorum]
MVRAADRLGYTRYWVAEHHNTESVASTSPAVELMYLGEGTSQIRLGSGGVMLPNHSPLAVAEQFALLTAVYGDRIDLGIGRAPGTDPITSAAIRGTSTAAPTWARRKARRPRRGVPLQRQGHPDAVLARRCRDQAPARADLRDAPRPRPGGRAAGLAARLQ